MKKDQNQLDLFAWADSRPRAQIIDLVPIIVRNMPEHDPQYPEPAKVIRPAFERKRGAA
ncbi:MULTISPECIES: hypothetical protein [Rhizobium]|jgi:hypothetical protein|uniref:hypothetical protein n=1 Tax=Rhizobium TaxID=379 RepID=UPI0013B826E4|nr:hypothetical protein [Rhizobium leguminosarum]NEI66844.1 hypothetical protein [Rhizobium leguminosarum]QIO57305.1 hypothetical protein HA463_06125 [Rhizobium leguminosarum bv. trifolii]